MKALPRALIMAGGTGGHVYPALAVAEGLRERGWQVDWVGTVRGLEAKVVPNHEFPLHTLAVRGLRGKGVLFTLNSLVRLVVSMFQAIALVRRLSPDVVLGMGGYVAGPAGMASAILRRPLVIHEQNAVAGTTNRGLAPFAKHVLCGLPGAFPDREQVQLVGNPVRSAIVRTAEIVRSVPDAFTAERPMQLLVLGGSLGSLPLNEGVPKALAELEKSDRARIAVRHQCGQAHRDTTEAAYRKVGFDSVQVVSFVDDMAAAYMNADLVVCRAGALTVSELAITRTPSILVPLPHAIDDHQTQNAQALSSHGAAQLLPQKEMTPTRLGSLLHSYLSFPGRLMAMSERAGQVARPEATENVVRILEEVAHAA